MADSGIKVHIYGDYNDKDINKAIKDLNSLKTQAAPTASGVGAVGTAFKNLALAAGGLYALKEIAGFLSDSVQAAVADQAELAKLNTVLENLGFGNRAAELQTWTDNLQFSANVSESVLRPALQSLITVTKDVDRAQSLMQLALDLSASGFGSVQDAANALSKAISTGTVARLNAFTKGALDPAIIKSKDLDGAIQQLGNTFGGAAAAKSKTLQSRMEGLAIAADELKESLGQGIIDGFVKAVGGGTDDIDKAEQSMRDMQKATEELGQTMGLAIAGALKGFIWLKGAIEDSAVKLWDWYDAWSRINIDFEDKLGLMGDAEADAARAALDLSYAMRHQAAEAAKAADAAAVAAVAATDYAGGIDTATAATEEGISASAAFLDATKALDAQWATKSARFAFLDYLDTVATKFDKNSKSLDAHTVAGRKNQTVLMEGYTTLTASVQKWADDTGASTEEIKVKTTRGIDALRKEWQKAGISQADIDKWLKTNTGWSKTYSKLVAKALAAGIDVGTNLGDGTIQGLRSRIADMETMATMAVNKMTAAAKRAGLIQSPSKVWYEIGTDLGDGLKNGLEVSFPRIAEEVTKGVAGITVKMIGEGEKLSGGLLQGFANRADAFKSVVEKQMDVIKGARQALDDYAKSVTDTVMGNIDLSATNADGTAMTPEAWIASLFGGIEGQANLMKAVASVTGLVPEAIQQQLLTMAPAQGEAFAKFLADPANASLVAKLKENYNGLATLTETTLGDPMAQAFAMVGGKSATKMIARAKARIAEEAADFQKWVQNHLDTTITVKVRYDTSDAPGRALGGPVTGSSPYIVGENGPELFVPWKSGTIIPNDGLPSAMGSYGGGRSSGGNNYSITVNAAVGDPRAIGQQIVEYVTKFEKANGKVFAAA
jgi:hypothetical protein